jgi:hypothetical protein
MGVAAPDRPGYLNPLLGNEGVGKGTLVAWLIAMLTHGELPGDLRRIPVVVGVLGDEDSFDDVWTPRLHAAGADLSRVRRLERPDGGFVNISEDRERLALVVDLEQIRILFFDQLLDNLGVGVDDWRNKAVRDALQPLRSVARNIDVAAIGCLHPNKRADSFRQLVAGAPAFNAVSRSSLLLAEHPEDECRRVLVRGKGNLSITPPALEFEIASHRFEANGHEFNVPVARSFGRGNVTIEELLTNSGRAEHSKVADAAEIIAALLPRDDQWHPTKPIFEACKGEEIGKRTVQRAKALLGVEHRRAQTFPASSEWRWPHTPDTHTTSAESVASVASDAPNPALSSSDDTHDTDDSNRASRQCVAAAGNGSGNSSGGRLPRRSV